MNEALPRVTYSNIGVDFAPLHRALDGLVPAFEAERLGRNWTTPFATGPVRAIVSPIDRGLVLGRFPDSTAADVEAALHSARAGAKVWNRAAVEERLAFARRWREALAARKYEIGLAALVEVGKSRMESIGEAEEAVDMIEFYAGELERNAGWSRPMRQLIEHETATSVMRPYGVFAVVSPFNFPVALSVGMLCGALLTGNAVVFKPSPDCALTGLMLAETLLEAGLPEGVFNIVLGGDEVGRALTTHRSVDGVAFTGSHATGMAIFRHMAGLAHMKPVNAEMGGKNPAYVTADADLDRAAQGVARSAFGLQGQKCSACSVVYVERVVRDAFVERLIAFTKTLKIGDPRRADIYMGPLYSPAVAARYRAAVADAKARGRVLHGGEALGGGADETYVQPAIVEFDGPDTLTREELFLPFLAVRAVDDLEAALVEGNAVNYGLCAGVYTRDEAKLNRFLETAEAGVLYANRASGATTGAWPGAQAFCGWKGTGAGAGKGGLGVYYLPQFMREQSRTIMTR